MLLDTQTPNKSLAFKDFVSTNHYLTINNIAMAPHATDSNGDSHEVNNGEAPLEPGIKSSIAQGRMTVFPRPPVWEDKYKEREYLKGRLAAAFRIFGKYGFDEGVAGHITLRDPVQTDCFWVNPFGRAFSLINKSDLIVGSFEDQD